LHELIELAFVDLAKPVEAGTADDFLLEALEQVGALFAPDQDVQFVDCAGRIQYLLE